MKKIISLAIMLFVGQAAYAKYYAQVTDQRAVAGCIEVYVTIFDDNSTTDPTDDFVVAGGWIRPEGCGGGVPDDPTLTVDITEIYEGDDCLFFVVGLYVNDNYNTSATFSDC